MDLGLAGKNQIIGDAISKQLEKTAKIQEQQIIDEINKYDALLEANDSELEVLRERRVAQMKKAQAQRQSWKANGHGEYTSIGEGQHGADVAKEFFACAKESDRLVVHFHRPATRMCDVFHSHLEKLAAKHMETRFVKINVDQCAEDGQGGGGASYLVDKLGIRVMPTIVIVRKRQAVHHIRGFDELGATEDFSTEALEWVLGAHQGVKIPEGRDIPAELMEGSQRKGINGINIKSRYSGGRRGGVRESNNEYDDEEDDGY
mmetsp:Transcript_18221/g.27661  ORF Transcript_18221/g.27661 Transcript_18221/m.27661 type:complete len:261 (-) Transcript_18221:329-1111(-)|eukprot:CAMPEP_0194075844 /NCGR_PEP_ID=MMETSP0149-20130528/2759_1 /TAXON_ID=122233 /ORGANISM="Chaetoceros debilis, Strain MM31A-1" /LENGTH=260 /DNA_ID=CAMNT_0038756429 /DNA_START=81 /DNA_END=866 /DNA_ORIENTATION=+